MHKDGVALIIIFLELCIILHAVATELMLTARFFKTQVLTSSSLLHYLLPDRRDNDTILSLRNTRPFHTHRARTKQFQKSFIPYCLDKLHIVSEL